MIRENAEASGEDRGLICANAEASGEDRGSICEKRRKHPKKDARSVRMKKSPRSYIKKEGWGDAYAVRGIFLLAGALLRLVGL